MTPLEEAPEQRWRRTVDRRSRPAKLKVERLLRDFGYAELDADAGEAIEARLASVALTVAPPLRDAAVGEVVTIYADESAIEPLTPPPEPAADAADVAPQPPPKPRRRAPRAAEPSVATDVAQMVSYLKQEVLDARAESERLRTELDRRIAARTDAEMQAEAIIAEQAATLQEQSRQIAEQATTLQDQSRQIAELGAALEHTRETLADTREEIRRAVGELQALPELERLPEELAGEGDDVDPDDELELGGDEPYGDPEAEGAGDEPAALSAAPAAWEPGDPVVRREEPAAEDEASAISDVGLDAEEPALGIGDAAAEFEDPAPAPALESEEPPAVRFDATALDLDGPALGSDPVASAPGAPEPAPAEAPALDPDPPPPVPDEAGEPESWVPAQLRATEPAPEPAPDDAPPRERSDDAVADFDDFLYDPDELYDPDTPDGDGPPLEPESEAPWIDQPTSVLPPPPPPPPSPWADEPEPEAPAAQDRPALGRALRGRGRGRWQGSCTICGRVPVDNKRKDLEAAGWDLDDHAAACPQCRGVG
jgi:hypothetical protein